MLTLICYVFLPFYDISFQGTLTGFSFTASTITQHPTVRHIAFALLPFISCFLAIGCNSLKNRWWSLLAAFFILGIIWFFSVAYNYHEIALTHQPDVVPSDGIGEGFSIVGLGVGFRASSAFAVLALLSALLSVLPFSFNTTIEQAVDDTIDRGIEDVRALGTRMSKDWQSKHAKQKHHAHVGKNTEEQAPEPQVPDFPAPEIDPEDPSRFMPH